MRVRVRPAGGGFGAPFRRAAQVRNQHLAGLNMSSTGRLAMAWVETSGRLRFSTRSASGAPVGYVGPYGATKLFWEAGCKGEPCFATSVRYTDRAP